MFYINKNNIHITEAIFLINGIETIIYYITVRTRRRGRRITHCNNIREKILKNHIEL